MAVSAAAQVATSSSSRSMYHNAVMAAPMVRVSTLAFRLVCAQHGSDAVWTEELVAAKLAKCVRRYLLAVEPHAEDTAQMPNRFAHVISRLFPAADEKKRQKDDAVDDTRKNIASIIDKWRQQHLPFIGDLLLAGRTEVIYRGHSGSSSSSSSGGDKQKQRQPAEGEDESQVGEICFTTLAERNITPDAAAQRLDQQDKHFALKQTLLSKLGLFFPLQEGGVPLVGQFGVFDPKVAVAGMELLAPFVRGVEINAGCPKSFSVKNGMGAALMVNKDNCAAIMGAMASSFPLHPVGYKTRLFEKVTDSCAHLKAMFEATRAAGNPLHCLTLHARNRPQRNETAPLYNDAVQLLQMIRADPELQHLTVIFNGSIAMRDVPPALAAAAAAAAPDQKGQQEQFSGDGATPLATTSTATTITRKEIDALILQEYSGKSQMLQAASRIGFNGALVARASMWKPSVFQERQVRAAQPPSAAPPPRVLALDVALREFQSLLIAYCAAGDQSRLLKYHLTRALPEYQQSDIARGLMNNTGLQISAVMAMRVETIGTRHTHVSNKEGGGDTEQQQQHQQVPRMPETLNDVFIGCRDGKTMQDFAKALHFSDEEIAALEWMCDFAQWRRANHSIWESTLMGHERGAVAERRERENSEHK